MLGARLLAVSYKAEAPCLAAAISPKAMNASRVGASLRQLCERTVTAWTRHDARIQTAVRTWDTLNSVGKPIERGNRTVVDVHVPLVDLSFKIGQLGIEIAL
jgi:hypothetical protein